MWRGSELYRLNRTREQGEECSLRRLEVLELQLGDAPGHRLPLARQRTGSEINRGSVSGPES